MPVPAIFTASPVCGAYDYGVYGDELMLARFADSGGAAPILLSPYCYTTVCDAWIVVHDLPRMVAGAAVKRHLERETFYDAFGADESYASTLDARRLGHLALLQIIRRHSSSSLVVRFMVGNFGSLHQM